MFLEPHSGNFDIFDRLINEVMLDYIYWRRNYFSTNPIVMGQEDTRSDTRWYDNLDVELRSALNNLKSHYPFYSPRYMAHICSGGTLANLEAVIFVPESAHYCFKKAASILGYGEDALRAIPVTGNFRINVDALKDMILKLDKNEYVASVVCVVGTTEEGD